MARRRYRSDAISTAGHSAQPRDPRGDESLAQPIEPRGEYGEPSPDPAPEQPAQHYDASGLKAQIAQQRQQQQADALDHYIAQAFPGATPNERQWLRMNAHHLQNPALVHHAAGIALQRGVPRQSPEFLHFVGALLDQHHHAAMQAQPAPPPPPPPPMPAHTHLDSEQSDHDSELEAEPTPSRYSAPVSRASETHSADYEPSEGSRITLTAAQREIANLPGGAGEVEYAKQLLKMKKMQKAKVHE